jgi:hypothetical protein
MVSSDWARRVYMAVREYRKIGSDAIDVIASGQEWREPAQV